MAAALGGGASESAVLSDKVSKLLRVRKTVAKMLHKRGYDVLDEDLELDAAGFLRKFGASPDMSALEMTVGRKGKGSDDRMMVFFPEGDLSVAVAKKYAARLPDTARRGIIILSGKFSAFARDLLKDLGPDIIVETFRQEELLVDITEHELVPEHQLLDEGQKAALLGRYSLRENQLPRIQQNDPVARYYGLRPGDVVKIVRKSETAGRYVTYRIVL